MFGSGIGELNVYVRNLGNSEDSKIWALSGDAGNNWYMGQAPISSSAPFKVSESRLESLSPNYWIWLILNRQTPASFSFFLVFSNKPYNLKINQCKNVMSIQYMVLGFEPTTSRTWVVSHNYLVVTRQELFSCKWTVNINKFTRFTNWFHSIDFCRLRRLHRNTNYLHKLLDQGSRPYGSFRNYVPNWHYEVLNA